MLPKVLIACLLALGLAACSGFTEVDDAGVPGDGPGKDVPTTDGPNNGDHKPPPPDGKDTAKDSYVPGGSGPGPWGALPSGFCCQSDDECRYRRCKDFGGGKMCSDDCWGDDSACTGPVSGLVCNKTASYCEPSNMSQPCTPSDQYKYGSSKLGACCHATGDGFSGQVCEGNRCAAWGPTSNPFICTHVCKVSGDCTSTVGNFICLQTGYGYGICGLTGGGSYSCDW